MKKFRISGLVAAIAVIFMVCFANQAAAAAGKSLPVTKANVVGNWTATLEGIDCDFSFLADGKVKLIMTDKLGKEERAGTYTVKDKKLLIVWNDGEDMNFDVLILTKMQMKLYEDFEEEELNLTRVIKK